MPSAAERRSLLRDSTDPLGCCEDIVRDDTIALMAMALETVLDTVNADP